MPDSKELIPQSGGLVDARIDADAALSDAFANMLQYVNLALTALLSQNPQNADTAALGAKALYEQARKQRQGDDIELQSLRLMRNLVCLYSPLVRSTVFSTEGEYDAALDSLALGWKISKESAEFIKQYEKLPDADADIVNLCAPMFSILPIIFRGSEANVRADIVGYQGNIPDYLALLQKAVTEYRKASELPPSVNPTFMTLHSLCTGIAERLQKRIQNFKAKPPQLYARPTGNKVFIIHGHDEAKWRDLRDLLKDQFQLEAIVLKEEAEAGKTLIQKFEDTANDCCYAFALLTPDDVVEKDGKTYLQARPNVLFELGWFYGRFGRERVCLIKKAATELPSDLSGILSIDFNQDVAEGFVKIQKELKKVGVIADKAQSSKNSPKPQRRARKT